MSSVSSIVALVATFLCMHSVNLACVMRIGKGKLLFKALLHNIATNANGKAPGVEIDCDARAADQELVR